MESRYVRERCKRSFMSSELNLTKLYQLYKLSKPEVTVCEKTYWNICNTSFNIGFHKSKKDQCNVCLEFSNSTPEQAGKLNEEYSVHQSNKAVARDLKENYNLKAQSDSTFSCYAFDLRKVLNLPYGENRLFYYSRNFSMCNVTFTDLADKSGFCYCWGQTVA